MSFNISNFNGKVIPNYKCAHDSNVGYSTDFSINGNVDGWNYYSGIHTYGCWNNVLFGTLVGNSGVIGRVSTFKNVTAKTFITVKIEMKINLEDRLPSKPIPTLGRVSWVTTLLSTWDSLKQVDFTINCDTEWHTYLISMGDAQWWQGDINNLRIYPIVDLGIEGDEFLIKSIEIISTNEFICKNDYCDYYPNYQHPCPGIGLRATRESKLDIGNFKNFSIEENLNDELLININGYGFEKVKLSSLDNITGTQLANILTSEISKTSIGGYSEVEVEFNNQNQFIIHSGTYTEDSSVEIGFNDISIYLNFFDLLGNDISVKTNGRTPASGFTPFSSLSMSAYQINNLLSYNKNGFYFNPDNYSVEAGRIDWLSTGLGNSSIKSSPSATTDYAIIPGADKTLIDFNHPFNASGRITKIYIALTLDNSTDVSLRGTSQLSNAKVMFFRPTIDGNLRVLPIEVSIPNRDLTSDKLYSSTQETVELGCDLFVNKGDYIGVYNANLYTGSTLTDDRVDALYYQIDGKASGLLELGPPKGYGQAGLLLYARGTKKQNRLSLSLDLGECVNIDNINIVGYSLSNFPEFNIARCLDISWQVDIGGTFSTSYAGVALSHPSVYFGKNCLNDGITTVVDGVAGDGYVFDSVGVLTNITNPKYFQTNGDCEWLHTADSDDLKGDDFSFIPVSFTLKLSGNKERYFYKSKIYFKEKNNFRSFALSLYKGAYFSGGNADDERFMLIPNRTIFETPWVALFLDEKLHTPEDTNTWKRLSTYLSKNPCIGNQLFEADGNNYIVTNSEDFSRSSGIDWTTITHVWPPAKAFGFRFYCSYHKSTKICEFEVYCAMEKFKPSLVDAVNVTYSYYGDNWFVGNVGSRSQDDGASVSIGGSPRYLNIDIKPITAMELTTIDIEISSKDVFISNKGCDIPVVLLDEVKKNYNNQSNTINFKNTFNNPYDLYVDIDHSTGYDKSLIFYSKLNNKDSIVNPIVGTKSYYKKAEDYKFFYQKGNVAINCPMYSLKNLIDGADAWGSYDNGNSFEYYGKLIGNSAINISNRSNITMTSVVCPVVSRNKWWKFGFSDARISMAVRKIVVYYHNEEISNAKFYYHKGQTDINNSSTDIADHLTDNLCIAYYTLNGAGGYIGIELSEIGIIDKIVLYNDDLSLYENSNVKAGIDIYTGLCIHGDGDVYQISTIKDYSYFEHEIQTIGSGIYCDTYNQKLGKSTIKFSGYINEYLLVKYSNSPVCTWVDEPFDFDWKRFTIDFFIKFNSLPSSGSSVTIAKSWLGAPTTTLTGSWALILTNVSNVYKLRFYINNDLVRRLMLDFTWAVSTNTWYHVMLCRGQQSNISSTSGVYTVNPSGSGTQYPCYQRACMLIDGYCVYYSDPHATITAYNPGLNWGYHVYNSGQDVIIGENLDGWVDELRISASSTPAGGRAPNAFHSNPIVLYKNPPIQQYEKLYSFSLYCSNDNMYYGKLADMDTMTYNSYSQYDKSNYWCVGYSSYLMIDLGQRHTLEFIRSFPVDTSFQVGLVSNIEYSNNAVDDVSKAFRSADIQIEKIKNMSFVGENNAFSEFWSTVNTGNSISYIKENKYYQHADGVNPSFLARTISSSNFYIVGNFDIQIDFEIYVDTTKTEWGILFSINDANNSNNVITIKKFRPNGGAHQYAVYIQDNTDLSTKMTYLYIDDLKGTFKIQRDKNSFKLYIKKQYETTFELLYSYRFINSTLSNNLIIKLGAESLTPDYPEIYVYWNNFKVTYGDIDYFSFSSYQDTRWLRIKIPNDGVTRTINKLGVYSDISIQSSKDGKNNNTWIPLGKAITDYTIPENIAIGATIKSSSSVGFMQAENLIDGILGMDLNSCWGSTSPTIESVKRGGYFDSWVETIVIIPIHWVTISFKEVQSIYKIVIYHGFDGIDTRNMVNDYTISVSTDDLTYYTIFTIVGNTEFIRTHELSTPINAKFVTITISKYTAEVDRRVWINDKLKIQDWNGAILREVEIYKYYGFTKLDSELYPIVAVDLQTRFFILGHTLIGVSTEDPSTDWDNSDSNFAYSNNNLSDPTKVYFDAWGKAPDYERWMVVKRNTATKYPLITDNTDYLKHIVINASVDEVGTKPNPIEFPWMWNSVLSTLSSDYTHVKNSMGGSLRIDYPVSSEVEDIYNIEGDTFGVDVFASWRDSLSFYWYIDNVNSVDLTYGSIYAGGYDGTESHNPILYRWDFTSFSGILQDGWNAVNLPFRIANSVEYIVVEQSNVDARVLCSITFSKVGLTFRGKNNSIGMNLDGFKIKRNHFDSIMLYDYGLYLHDHDILKVGVSDLNFQNFTIEFFIRPDWSWSGTDIYNEHTYRALFHISNTNNDVIGASVSAKGLGIYYGNLAEQLFVFSGSVDFLKTTIPYLSNPLDLIFHLAFVFSNDGSGIDSDKSTIRIYINNTLLARNFNPWMVGDSKLFNFIFGGQGLFSQKGTTVIQSSSVDAVISNLKIFNYCKTDFTDSINNEVSSTTLIKPQELIEISFDNVTFYRVGSVYLPLKFTQVTPNSVVPVYVKANLPYDLTGKEKRTASIVGSWNIGV